MLDRQIASAAARQALARLESRPDVTVGVNYIQTARSTVSPQMAGSGRDPWSISVAVNLPIWRDRVQAARRESDASHDATAATRANRFNQLCAQARAAHLALSDALRRFAVHRDELLPLARQAAKNKETSFESGRATLFEMIDAERTLLDLELALAQAATDTAQRRIALLTLANQPL
ncbi:MAG: TolC family protein [Candidatus Synoicihabitans palmerolidicus]|nr:TolC family protein [Candidatus Synoicihabitans palmerolidicus]